MSEQHAVEPRITARRQRLDGRAITASADPLARAACAILRRVYARAVHPAIAASALAGLGFVAADNATHCAAHVEAEAQTMVALLLGSAARRAPAAAPAADHIDPLS